MFRPTDNRNLGFSVIRRRHGDGYAVIRQDDHARLCGDLLRHWGTSRFPRPQPFADVFAAVVLHDCGWAMLDDAPVPTSDGRPPDVFDPPPRAAATALPGPTDAGGSAEWASLERLLSAWTRSAQLAAVAGPWAQLLVSVHALTLSAYAAGRATTLPLRFLFNRFQHGQIELQERLRRQLGMSLEWPLTHGLADLNTAPDARRDELEVRLIHHYRHLQALDLLSLAVCCQTPPTDRSGPLTDDGEALHWQLRPGEPQPTLRVSPWPFAVERLELRVSARVLGRGPYPHRAVLADALGHAPAEVLEVVLVP